jgi:hypothetical protein
MLQGQLLGALEGDRSMFRLTACLGTLQVLMNYEGSACATLSQVDCAIAIRAVLCTDDGQASSCISTVYQSAGHSGTSVRRLLTWVLVVPIAVASTCRLPWMTSLSAWM